MKSVLYPGTFDPLTFGHVDVIERAGRLSETVILAVANGGSKTPLLPLDQRFTLLQQYFADNPKVKVIELEGLLADCAKTHGVDAIVRGIRNGSDFDYEYQLAGMNRNLYPEMETLFLTPAEQYTFISATMVREVARFGGDVSKFVSPLVATRLQQKY